MKKIALCISGYPRLYKVSYENFKKNIIEENKEYEFDFFLYIKLANENTCYFKYNIDKYNYDIEDIIKTYNPKKYIVDKINPRNKNISNEHVQQCDNVINCIKMKQEYENENNIKYDYVFKYRFELYIPEPTKIFLPEDMNECIISHVNQEVITMYKSHFVNINMNIISREEKIITQEQKKYMGIIKDLQIHKKKSPFSDVYFICKSNIIDNIVQHRYINKLVKKEFPEAYYEIIFFSLLLIAGIDKYKESNIKYYCLHQIFCNNKPKEWNIDYLNTLRKYINEDYYEECNNELYKNVLLY